MSAAVEAAALNSDTTLQIKGLIASTVNGAIKAQDVLKADASYNTASGFGALASAAGAAENDAHGYNALSQLITGIQKPTGPRRVALCVPSASRSVHLTNAF